MPEGVVEGIIKGALPDTPVAGSDGVLKTGGLGEGKDGGLGLGSMPD